MATNVAIPMYGISEEWIRQHQEDAKNGIVRYHPTTWMEYNIPRALEKKLEKMVDKELDKFYKKCQCEDCKERRNKK
jgi:hypothetical protein